MTKLTWDSSSRDIRLSPRERECLVWAARGKTAWETAKILGASERVVRFHMENAMRKMQVHTKTHAVVTAIIRGDITP